MNTPAASVGLIELSHLAAFCDQVGLHSVTGEDYRTAATSIRAGLDATGPFPILVSDSPWPGMRAWMEKAARETTVVLLRGADGNGTQFSGITEVTLPATIGDIFTAAGLSAPAEMAALRVDVDGRVGTSPVAVTEEPPVVAALTDDLDVPDAVIEQAPVEPDPWEAQKQTVAPVVVPQYAPTHAVAPAAPAVTEQAPVEPDPWEAQKQAISPVVEEPVYVPEPVPVIVETPAEPVYIAPPAPVAEEPVYVPEPVVQTPIPAPPAPVAYEPVVQAPIPAPPAPVMDDYDYDDQSSMNHRAPVEQHLGEIAVVWAGKGGVGKSTFSFSLAQRAAKAGLRVILIDGNFGQGDMRSFLRIGNAGLPSIYQSALSGDLRHSLIDPDTLNSSRSPKLDPLGFALVQAPPAHLTDPAIVTPEAYLSVVEQARRICDLVVIDTQIIESVDTSGMVDRLVAPLLREGAWGVGVTDLSVPGISNLLTRLKAFAAQGIRRDKQMTAMNRIPRTVAFNAEGVASAFNEHSVFLGTVYVEDAITEALNRGRAVSHMPVIAPILDAALIRVTGRNEFSPNVTAAATAQANLLADTGVRAGGFMSRFRKVKV